MLGRRIKAEVLLKSCDFVQWIIFDRYTGFPIMTESEDV